MYIYKLRVGQSYQAFFISQAAVMWGWCSFFNWHQHSITAVM